MTRIALALLFGLFLQNTPPPAKATISGTVLRAGTGEPIPRATVTLVRAVGVGAVSFETSAPGARGATPPQSRPPVQSAPPAVQLPGTPPTATTDERGHFQISDVDPGSYRIAAGRNGFAKQEYGQRSFNRSGTIVSIRSG